MKKIQKNVGREIMGVLYNLRSVYNTASIVRTADAAGVSKLYFCGTTPGPLDRIGNPRDDFRKVSLGAENTVLWEHVPIRETPELIKNLQGEGWFIVAVEQSEDSVPYHRVPDIFSGRKKMCLVVGNEVSGLPRSLLELSDAIVEIPMLGKKESLNVSVAFGIVAFRMRYQ